MKTILKIILIITLLIIFLLLFFLQGFSYSETESLQQKDGRYLLEKDGFFCQNDCYRIITCSLYYDSCEAEYSSRILMGVEKVNEMYLENDDTLVIVIPKDTNLAGKWGYKKLNGINPEKQEFNGLIRENYGYLEAHKINIIVEYK
jgi:hypothetical protein